MPDTPLRPSPGPASTAESSSSDQLPSAARGARHWAMGLVAWSLFVWSTRISNAWKDHHASTASKLGATLLSLSFVALAAATIVVLIRSRRRIWTAGEVRLLEAFAGWTTAVWLVFGTLILVHHHPLAFKAVHVTLGLISIGLSAAVWRSARAVAANR